MKKLFYEFVHWLVRSSLRLYFSQIEINGVDQIPDDDIAIIYAPNHQNAFLDALILGGLSPRPIHFLTRSDVFVPPFLWFLDALHMMPIYRIRDGYATLSQNEAVFEACTTLLRDAKPILIFPEGNQEENHYLRPLTKGISRLALGAAAQIDRPLQIVPVGINYFDHYHPGRKLILNYGTALDVQPHLDQYHSNKAHALKALRADLTTAMQELLVIPEPTDHYLEQRNVFSRKNEDLSFSEIRALATGHSPKPEAPHSWLRPLAMLLMLPNFGAYGLTYFILYRYVPDRGFWASLKFAIGMLYFPIWWILTFVLVGCFAGLWAWAVGVLSLQFICFYLRLRIAPLTR